MYKKMTMTVCFLLCLLCLWGCSEKMTPQEAVLLTKAEKGNPEDQYSLGMSYAVGMGVPKNRKKSLKWVRMAAEQGYAKAQVQMGRDYMMGVWIKKDEVQAFQWFQLAAKQYEPDAMSYMGFCYALGFGVMQNDEQATKWYSLAAMYGDRLAQEKLDEFKSTGKWH